MINRKEPFKLACLVLVVLATAQFSNWGIAQATEMRQGSMPKCQEAKAGGPEEVVRRFYDQYPWAGDKIFTKEPRKVIQKFFDEKLTRLLVKYQKCDPVNEHCPSIPGIWNDGTLDTNDMDDLHVCAMDTLKKTVTVQYKDSGHPQIVIYKLSNMHDSWRISDIVYVVRFNAVDPDQPDGWSLVDHLSGN